jgi:hypothetical protein
MNYFPFRIDFMFTFLIPRGSTEVPLIVTEKGIEMCSLGIYEIWINGPMQSK